MWRNCLQVPELVNNRPIGVITFKLLLQQINLFNLILL